MGKQTLEDLSVEALGASRRVALSNFHKAISLSFFDWLTNNSGLTQRNPVSTVNHCFNT
jgi:hypothetical protein